MATTPSDHRHLELFRLFVSAYKEFDEKFQHGEAPAIISFGITGAGKSQFLARLKSKLSPADFLEAVQADKEGDQKTRFTTIEGVKVGHGAPSTTLVPELHLVLDQLGVYDVPGFKDNDTKKEVVINILHKCLLGRVPCAKFIVVLDVGHLFKENAMTVFVNDYHAKLKELFGEANYREFIQTIRFVLTHNDKHKKTPAQIRAQIERKIVEFAATDNAFLVALLYQLKQDFFILDYATQTNEDLIAYLNATVRDHEGIYTSKFHLERLTVQSNLLNQYAVETMDSCIDDLESREREMTESWKRKCSSIEARRAEITSVESHIAECQANLASYRSDIVCGAVRGFTSNFTSEIFRSRSLEYFKVNRYRSSLFNTRFTIENK
eukprot:m.113252 g.113252  ORF g.113252 m.113252 type:complete len:380 (-) comp13506_c2_seq5:82-1221(-)